MRNEDGEWRMESERRKNTIKPRRGDIILAKK